MLVERVLQSQLHDLLKFNRYDSSKISFLLAIPALAGASVLSLKDILIKVLILIILFYYQSHYLFYFLILL